MTETQDIKQTAETIEINPNKDNYSEFKETSLNFEAYAEALSESIMSKDNDKALIIGIFGKWGSGKTTLMKTIEKKITSKKNTDFGKTIWFNAWKFDKEDAVRRALIIRVLEELKPEEKKEKKFEEENQNKRLIWLKEKEKRFLRFFNSEKEEKSPEDKRLTEELNFLQASLYKDVSREELGAVIFDKEKAVKGILNLGLSTLQPDKIVISLLESIHRAKKEINVEKVVQYLEQFQKSFEDLINKHFVLKKKSVIIFIDDLDRCLPEKALEVLEAIKLFMDVKGCIFILGIDKDVINYIVYKKYEDLFENYDEKNKETGFRKGNAAVAGQNYLEKIIQLSFNLPTITNGDMVEFIYNLKIDREFYRPYIRMITKGIEPNPRKIKRLFKLVDLQRHLNSELEKLRSEENYNLSEQENIIFEAMMIEWAIITSNHPDFWQAVSEKPSILYDMHQYHMIKEADKFLFTWDEIPKSDSQRLKDFLNQNHNIEWIKISKIEKIDNGKTIKFSTNTNSLSLELNDEKNKVIIKIDDIRKDEFIAKPMSGDLNIYAGKITKQVDEDAENYLKKIGEEAKKFLDEKKYSRLNDLITQFYISLQYQLIKEKDIETIITDSLDNIIERVISLSNVAGIEKTISLEEKHLEKEETKTEETKESRKPLGRDEVIKSIDEKRNLNGANLEDGKFEEVDWKGIKLNGANLTRAKLNKSHLENANLIDSILDHAELKGAYLNQAKLVRAKLNSATLDGANLTGAKLNNAKLWHATLRGANLNNALLRDAELYSVSMSNANLTGADLFNAGLMGANMKGTILGGANLRQVNLKGAVFDDKTDFIGADIDSVTIDNLAGSNWEVAKWDDYVLDQIVNKYGKKST